MSPTIFIQQLVAALALDQPIQLAGPVPRVREPQAAVLALFAWGPGDQPHLLMTQRTETVGAHKGQMAFPGGVRNDGESLKEAALRETEEEVGISSQKIQLLGALPEFQIPTSRFWVTPHVGFTGEASDALRMQLSRDEIDRAFWIPFSALTHPDTYRREMFEREGHRFPIHVYQVEEYRIWGATAAMIRNLLERLDAV